MITEQENRILTEVGPKTPMGRFMREYWVPVLRSPQLESGGAPRRVRVFGENFVAFRSPSGEVGLMEEACPHRGASMLLARNEDCGLRCIYHGWKIAPSGALLEAPTHAEDAPLHKISTHSHPVRESQGMIWTWLGKGTAAPFPKLAFTNLPDDHVIAGTTIVNCSWLQPLEILWDTFHGQILHNHSNRAAPRGKGYFSKSGRQAGDLSFDYPGMRAWRTPYGFHYVNSDAAKESNFDFVVPFMQHIIVTAAPTDDKGVQISVPIDDDHTLLWLIFYNRQGPLNPAHSAMQSLGKAADLNDFMALMGDRTAENRWGQNRTAMDRGESFTGVSALARANPFTNIFAEDIFVVESQGRVDRSKETLSPVDLAVVEGRRTLLDAVAAYERGELPRGQDLDLTAIDGLFVLKNQAAE